jgi:hypothetical protein
MNRFLVASALVGSTLGFFHGRQIRPESESILHEVAYSARDAAIGAVVYPFVIPIGVFQIATKSSANTCVFKSIASLFSQPLSETLK